MDPASLALGAIPIAIAIIDGSCRIRRTFRLLKSVPSDIYRLSEKLEIIEGQCNSVRHVLERLPGGSSTRSTSIPGTQTAITKSLSRIAGRVEKIESVLAYFTESLSDDGAFGKRDSIKFLLKKDRIDELIRELDGDLGDLNRLIVAQMWYDTIIHLIFVVFRRTHSEMLSTG